MCHAAKMAQEVNLEYSPQTKRFRGFMFLFANVFMHELGHLFTTFLYKGRRNTPTYIYGAMMGVSEGSHSYGGSRNYGHPRVASEPARGEAGRKLEELLFGGLTCFYRQPITEDERQVCSYLLSLENGILIIASKLIRAPARRTLPSHQ